MLKKSYSLFAIFSLLTASNSYSAQALGPLGVWSEWIPYPQVEKHLEELSKNRLRIHLAVRQDEVRDPANFSELVHLLHAAQTKKVDVWIWPLLAQKEGYWLNQWNAPQFKAFTLDLLDNLEAQGVSVKGVSFDLEPPLEKLEALLSLAKKLKLAELTKTAQSYDEPDLFCAARSEIRDLAQTLHQRKLLVHAVTTPFILHDFKNKVTHPRCADRTMQRVLGIPLDAENFDLISFMAYRSEFKTIIGGINSRLVYTYGQRARAAFGGQAGLDLGIVGNLTFPHPLIGYQEPSRLKEDLAAARAAGIGNLQIYSLDGMVLSEDPNLRPIADWVGEVQPHKPGVSIKFSLLDGLL
ncbi:hypothetical protein WDW86_15210 [Bdellovibrionota bacterium FG-2]